MHILKRRLNFILYLNPFNIRILKIIKYFPSFYRKSPSAKGQRAGISKLPRQNDFRTFCMSDETEEVYHKLEEIINT
jgi:hypothetical protein